MSHTSVVRLAVLLVTVLLAGCASGKIGSTPQVQRQDQAATLTLSRGGSWVGFFAPFHIRLDRADLYRLGRNQSYTVQLDPGEYLVQYTIGFNSCRFVANLRPQQIKRLRLTANCVVTAN